MRTITALATFPRFALVFGMVLASGIALISGCSSGDPITTPADGCRADETYCDGSCSTLDNDPSHCGACGNACSGEELCSVGKCGLECVGGTTKCGDLCVDTQADPAHCGACDSACTNGEVCSAGQCGLECVGGTTKCGATCTNTANDPAHCGQCDNACPSPANADGLCFNSTCASLCKQGYYDCNASMTDGCESVSPCLLGVNAFGEFRPRMTCANFVNNGNNYQQYCFDVKAVTMCIGQTMGATISCTDKPNGIQFVFDFAKTYPMRFTKNTATCQNYHPQFVVNLQLALGYNQHTINQTKTGNSCTRTSIDANGVFQSTSGNNAQAQIYDIDFHD